MEPTGHESALGPEPPGARGSSLVVRLTTVGYLTWEGARRGDNLKQRSRTRTWVTRAVTGTEPPLVPSEVGGGASRLRNTDRRSRPARQGECPERRSTRGRRGGRRAGTPSRSPKSEQGGGSHPPGEVWGQPVPAHRPEGGSSEEAEARDSPRKKDPPLGCKDLPAGVALETLRYCEVQGQPLSARRPGDVSSAAPGPQRPHRLRGKLRAAGASACGGGQRGLRDAPSSQGCGETCPSKQRECQTGALGHRREAHPGRPFQPPAQHPADGAQQQEVLPTRLGAGRPGPGRPCGRRGPWCVDGASLCLHGAPFRALTPFVRAPSS